MGYKAQTVKITSGQMVVKMEPDNQLLDEVVVIGYGTMKKRDLTGSIASVKSEDIVLNPGTNPMQALQGKVPVWTLRKSPVRLVRASKCSFVEHVRLRQAAIRCLLLMACRAIMLL